MTYYGFVMPMRYPKYKQSQIDWLGEIPQEWKITKLKFSDLVIMGQSPDSEDYNYQNSGLPFLQGNAEFTDLYPKPVVWCEKANKIAIEKDVLLSVRAPIGAVNIADQKYGIGRGLCAIRCKKSYYRFVYYQLLVAEQELNSIGTGSTYTAISVDDVKNLMLALPSKDEQIQISKYLDNQLLKINKILDRDIQLIRLLKEKRGAVINNGVTKGINPKVTLKNSGIGRIGKIPEKWEIRKLKFCSFLNRKTIPENTDPKYQFNYLDISNVDGNGNIIGYEEMYFEDAPSRARRVPRKGDTILSTVRTYLKAIAYLDDIPEKTIVSTGFAVIEPLEKIYPKYLFYSVSSEAFIQEVIANSKGVAYPAINPPDLSQIHLIIPPKDEQIAISKYLDIQTKKIDDIVTIIQQRIDLLQEYKESLIYNTITGKNKVIAS